MSATAESDDTLVRQLPTDDLRAPQHDVRQTRSDEDIRTISESMERSGQLHAAYVVPICPSDVNDEDEWRNQPVEDLDSECTSYRIIDGMTRWLAAQELNWATLRCEVHATPPENQTVTSLEANTSRVDMSDYGNDPRPLRPLPAERRDTSGDRRDSWHQSLPAREPLPGARRLRPSGQGVARPRHTRHLRPCPADRTPRDECAQSQSLSGPHAQPAQRLHAL